MSQISATTSTGGVASPFAVAHALLSRAKRDGVTDMTPMKLIKLAYICHGWHLYYADRPLLTEPVEAWKYGPVVPSLYRYFKTYGADPIPDSELDVMPPMPANKMADDVIDVVWQAYRRNDGLRLSASTHRPNTPWWQTWHDAGGKNGRGVTIDNECIRAHYTELAAKTKE